MKSASIPLSEFREDLLFALDFAESLGASACRIGLFRRKALDCSFESGRLKSARNSENVNFGINVVMNGREGRTSGNRPEDLLDLVERAVTLTEVGRVAHFETYPAPAAFSKVRRTSADTCSLGRETLIASAGEIVERLKGFDDGLDIHASGSRSESEGLLVTSGGVCYPSGRSVWSLGGGVQRTRGTDILFSHFGRSWCRLNDLFDPVYIAGRIEEDLRFSEKTVGPPENAGRIFVPPHTLARFFGPVFGALNGRNVARGTSPLKGRLGERVFSPELTLVDDPHVDYCPGAAEVDSAGIPTARCVIVENGVLQMFLYDLDSAGLAGVDPTGHSGCHPYSPEIFPGKRTSDELLADIDDGLYVKNLLGFGQSNVMNGDFSTNVALGYRIRDGEIVGRVKDTMIAGNLYDVFAGNVEFSSDRDPLNRMPYAVLGGVSLSSKHSS